MTRIRFDGCVLSRCGAAPRFHVSLSEHVVAARRRTLTSPDAPRQLERVSSLAALAGLIADTRTAATLGALPGTGAVFALTTVLDLYRSVGACTAWPSSRRVTNRRIPP
jgi:hypothetical protein